MQFEAVVKLNRRQSSDNAHQVNKKVYDLLNKALSLLKSSPQSEELSNGLDELIEETESLDDVELG